MPQVNDHVTYITGAGKLLSGTVVSVGSINSVTLRIGHTGQVLTNVSRQTGRGVAGTWRHADAHIGATIPGTASALLIEDGSVLLQENDSRLLI